MDEYTETTVTSYKDRVIGALVSVILGVILFFASFFVLWINEGASVLLIKQHDIAKKEALPIMDSPINRANDLRLVHLSGYAKSNAVSLSDGQIRVRNALSLNREVEMYQWKETKRTSRKDNAGGSETSTTTYSYSKTWSDKRIASSSFKHQSGHENPPFTEESVRVDADSAALGDFSMNEKQISRMSAFVDITNLPYSNKYSVVEGKYYSGINISDPQVGDVKISYSYMPTNSPVSIIAQQNPDNTLRPYDKSDTSVYIQMDGLKNKKVMLDKFKASNTLKTIGFRLLGLLMMFAGLKIVFNPIVIIAKIIPPLAWIAEFASGIALAIISLILSLLTIAIAWLFFRPILSICLIAVIVGLVMLLIKKTER